jgi:thiol-disulfide isomerase/thioredoxin
MRAGVVRYSPRDESSLRPAVHIVVRPRIVTALAMVVLAAVSVVLTGCSASQGGTARSTKPAGSVDVVGVTTYAAAERRAVPAVAGQSLDGRSLSLDGLARGKIVVLNVWASWCGPCREESPMLAAAAKSLEAKGVLFLGIDEQDQAAAARAFASSTGMAYPSFVDKDGSLLRKLTMLPQMGIPSTLVLDRRARVAARVIGPITLSEVTQVIDKLLAET